MAGEVKNNGIVFLDRDVVREVRFEVGNDSGAGGLLVGKEYNVGVRDVKVISEEALDRSCISHAAVQVLYLARNVLLIP